MTWNVELECVGGILQGSARVETGLNVIRGSNWQGKSSFLQALGTALGVKAPLTEGRSAGHVSYESPTASGRVELQRAGDRIETSGEPYLTDEYDRARVELFACLGEDNELRQAVRTDADLADLMLRPLDFENIDEQIREYRHEREQVDAEISRAEQARKRRPGLRSRVEELEDELSTLRTKREEISSVKANDGGSVSRSELSDVESELATVEDRIDRLEESIERTEASLEETEAEREALEVPDESDLQSELSDVEDGLHHLRGDKSVLESVYSATEQVLNGDRLDLVTDVTREVSGDTVVCWTCGQPSLRDDLESQLAVLRKKISELQSAVDTEQSTLEQLKTEREQIQQKRNRARSLEADADRLREKLSADRQSLETARERQEGLTPRVESLSAEVRQSVAELTDVESEIKYREAELEDVRSDLAEMNERVENLDRLETERERIQSELESLRDRKASIKRQTREQFDTAMQEILDRFETGFETARLTPEFELVVARDGRRASLDALSEGELELLGFVAALAGYEAFEVGEVTPLLLVDRVGGLDEENLRTLVEYLRNRTEYLVFTAYPAFEPLDATVIEPESWAVTEDN